MIDKEFDAIRSQSHRLRSVGFVIIEGSDAYDPAGGAAQMTAGALIDKLQN